MPVLDECRTLRGLLQSLETHGLDEILVADGGSRDGTREWLAGWQDAGPGRRVLDTPAGRGIQMRAAAGRARSDVLWFLHADCRPPPGAGAALRAAVADGAAWGRFDVRLDSPRPAFRIIEAAMNLRSRLTGICTGDQAIFVRRDIIERIGGHPEIPLMEDIALTRRLRRLARPACLPLRVRADVRRWEAGGVWRTVCYMWWLRARYWAGADPAVLARGYRAVR